MPVVLRSVRTQPIGIRLTALKVGCASKGVSAAVSSFALDAWLSSVVLWVLADPQNAAVNRARRVALSSFIDPLSLVCL